VGFALFSVLAFFLLSETVLYGVSKLTYHQMVGRLNPQREAKTSGIFRVATFGDSVTVGQGTAPQYSYPRQLEELLNENAEEGQFEVVNSGVYALNSSRTADLLPNWLEAIRPDLIVVMTGCNNPWNYRNSHLEELGLLEADERKPLLKLLDKTRTYRFFRVLLKRQKTGFGIAAQQDTSLGTGRRLRISETISVPVDPTARTLERQRSLFRDKAALTTLLEHDLSLITETASESGASIALMTYPFRPVYQEHHESVLQFAEERGLIAVNNLDAFERVSRSRPELDLFSADRGHPNSVGYRVIAANVYDQMRLHQERLGIALGPTPDPLSEFKDQEYLERVYREVKRSAEQPGAGEYVFEVLGHIAMELENASLAEDAFLTAFEQSGGAPQFYESLGKLYVRQEKWDALDQLKERMLALRGDRSDISFFLQMFEREAELGRRGTPRTELGTWPSEDQPPGPRAE